MLREFKEFAFKGNVVDLAVAVIIGAAFGKIVTAVVDGLLIPIIGILLGGVDFSRLSINVGEAHILYGAVIQAVIDFVIIAFFIFLMIKSINKISKKPEEPEEAPAGPSEAELLTEIRDLLKEK